jgi:hypothetical protein
MDSAHQRALRFDGVQPARRKLAEPARPRDLPEHRLDRLPCAATLIPGTLSYTLTFATRYQVAANLIAGRSASCCCRSNTSPAACKLCRSSDRPTAMGSTQKRAVRRSDKTSSASLPVTPPHHLSSRQARTNAAPRSPNPSCLDGVGY